MHRLVIESFQDALPVSFAGLPVVASPAPLAADGSGRFVASFTVPSRPPGSHPVKASQVAGGAGRVIAGTIFTVE